jgi:hypothetical protein
MPKDISKNVARYKIAGGELNEFEFQQNQQDLAEQQKGSDEHLIPGTPPEQTVAEVVESVQKVVAKRSKSAGEKRSTKAAVKRKVASKKKTTSKKTATRKQTPSKKKATASKAKTSSRKVSKKASKKASKKVSKKVSKKASKKASKK